MRKRTVSALFLAICLSSCTHYYYIPNTQNVPLFREKKEYRASVNYGQNAKLIETTISGIEVQAAYSVTNHIAVMTNFMSAKGGTDTNNSWAKGKYLEGAIGYYKPFGKFGVFEVYSGFGMSNQHHQYARGNNFAITSDLSFTKFFLQPSLGLAFFDAADIVLSSRICRLDFYEVGNPIIPPQISISGKDLLYIDTIAQNRISYLLEPAITLRYGWKYVKLQFQYVHSINLNNPNLQFEKNYASIGLNFSIAKRYRKDVSKKNNLKN